MEILKSNSLRRTALAVSLLGGSMAIAACGEQPAPRPNTDVVSDDLFNNSSLELVRPGQSVLVDATSDYSSELTAKIPMVDHQYPHGIYDDSAPTVLVSPIRLDTHVALSGRSPEFNNDLACDTLNVETTRLNTQNMYIGALALTDSGRDTLIVTWPNNTDGTASENIYVCFDNGGEPQDGVVLFVDDRPR